MITLELLAEAYEKIKNNRDRPVRPVAYVSPQNLALIEQDIEWSRLGPELHKQRWLKYRLNEKHNKFKRRRRFKILPLPK